MARSIHISTARKLLESGQPCDLKLWKMSNGEILHYKDAICISTHRRGASHRVKLRQSGEIRHVFDFMIFEINDMEVYL